MRQVSAALRDELIVVWGSDKQPYIKALLRQKVTNRPLHVLHELGLLSTQLGIGPIAAAQINDRCDFVETKRQKRHNVMHVVPEMTFCRKETTKTTQRDVRCARNGGLCTVHVLGTVDSLLRMMEL